MALAITFRARKSPGNTSLPAKLHLPSRLRRLSEDICSIGSVMPRNKKCLTSEQNEIIIHKQASFVKEETHICAHINLAVTMAMHRGIPVEITRMKKRNLPT